MDELKLLKVAFRSTPDPDAATVQRARRDLCALALRRRTRGVSHHPHDRARSRFVLPALGAGILTLVASVLTLVVLSGGAAERASAAAAKVLRAAARVAVVQPDQPLLPGQYRYQRILQGHLARLTYAGRSFDVLAERIQETWFGSDASGRVLDTLGAVRPASVADRAAWQAVGAPDLHQLLASDANVAGLYDSRDITNPPGSMAGYPVGIGNLDADKLMGMPTEPGALEAELRAADGGRGRGADSELFVTVADLLRAGGVPSAVRAALFEVAARIPGVDFEGKVTDPLGRRGVAVVFDGRDRGRPEELVIDPRTSQLLGDREWSPGTSPSGPLQTYSAVYMTRGISPSMTERPDGQAVPRRAGATAPSVTSSGAVGQTVTGVVVVPAQGTSPVRRLP